MLGLPSSVNDALYRPTEELMTDETSCLQQGFARRCTIVVGKIIDRNVAAEKPSFAHTMTIEEELEAIESSMPKNWWEVTPSPEAMDAEADKIRERLLLQLTFFHARAYLHMPFIVSSRTASSYPHSRILCMQAASGVIRRHIALVAEIKGERLFDCRSTIFISFMMAVVLILGLPGSRGLIDSETSQEYRKQIDVVKDIIEREERERSCKISAQCSKALTLLLNPQKKAKRISESFSTADNVPIPIPYFGTVIRREVLRKEDEEPAELKAIPPSPPLPNDQHHAVSTLYDGTLNGQSGSMPILDLEQGYWEVEGGMNFNIDNLGPYTDSTWMDIDQGWSTFADDSIYNQTSY